jgi:hypothetical protein
MKMYKSIASPKISASAFQIDYQPIVFPTAASAMKRLFAAVTLFLVDVMATTCTTCCYKQKLDVHNPIPVPRRQS